MKTRNSGDKAKPEAVSCFVSAPLQPVKTLEHVLLFGGGNSRSIVDNGNNSGAITIFRNRDRYITCWATMFDCIVDQVGYGVEDEVSIARDTNLSTANEV
jgi:hypothetical protein